MARELRIRLSIMLRDQIDYHEFCRRGQTCQNGEACAGMPETRRVRTVTGSRLIKLLGSTFRCPSVESSLASHFAAHRFIAGPTRFESGADQSARNLNGSIHTRTETIAALFSRSTITCVRQVSRATPRAYTSSLCHFWQYYVRYSNQYIHFAPNLLSRPSW